MSDITDAGGLATEDDVEGTAVKSTGETGGLKFLREDGDGTCSWQSVPGGGDMLSANNLSDVGNAATAFGNIKQDATTSATGVVELATDGESASGKVVQGNDARLTDARTPTSHTHTLSDVTDAGTSASLDVPAAGDAAVGEVVKGDDSRLTDARTPTSHNHDADYMPIAEPYYLQAALSVNGEAISAGTFKGFARVPKSGNITDVTIDCDPNNEPSAAAVQVDCNTVNRSTGAATSVLSAVASIATSGNTGSGTVNGTQAVSAGDLLSFDIDQGSDGKDLIVTVEITPT